MYLSVATIKSYSSVPTFSLQLNSSPSVPTPFSCKTSVATCLSLQSQPFSHKHSVGSPQLHHFSPKPSVATDFSCNPVCFQFQGMSCNHSVPTLHLQPLNFSLKHSLVTLQFKLFSYKPSVTSIKSH